MEQTETGGRSRPVTMDQNGTPLAGVRISARDEELIQKNRPDWNTDFSEIEASLTAQLASVHLALRRTETDSDGRFEFGRLNPNASYRVSASGDEYGSRSHSEVACGTELLIVLDASSIVTFKVSDPEGQPIEEIKIRRMSQGSTFNSVWKSRDGKYYVVWSADVHSFSVSADGFLAHFDTTEKLVGETVYITLQRAPIISGVVSGREGSPLKGATVRIIKGADNQGEEIDLDRLNWRNYINTDAGGRYRIDWLPRGT